jgi:hypothetical protein
MNHCERSPSPASPEIWAERAICREVRGEVALLEHIEIMQQFRIRHHMSVPHAVCGGVWMLG